MKLLFLFLILLVYSCANPSAESLCNGNPCKEAHRTVCKLDGDTFNCLCDEGYKDKYGVCIKDTASESCEPNPCKTEHRTICNSDNGFPVCLCDNNYHDENGACVENTNNCSNTEHDENGLCISNTKMVDCNPITPPINATSNNSQVEITWNNGSWSQPSDCGWVCNDNYHPNQNNTACEENTLQCEDNEHEENNTCISNTKMVDCSPITPPVNATSNNSQVEITWNNGLWSIPDDCTWTCKNGYHPNQNNTACEEDTLQCEDNEHEENNTCISNTKTEHCTNNTPATGINVDDFVEITWNNGSWSTPADCEWYCNPGYNKTATGCEIIGNPGVECTSDNTCLGENTFCADYTSNGYCSATCTRDGDVCMTDGVCSSQVCYKTCTVGDDSTCERSDLICINGENNIGGVCKLKCYSDSECNSGYCAANGHCEVNYMSCEFDTVSNSGCSDNNTCFDDNGSTYCYPNLGKHLGDVCSGARECIAQYDCIGNTTDGYTCHELCRDNGSGDFENTTDCQSGPNVCSGNITGEDYGYCLFSYETCNADPVSNSGCPSDEICIDDNGQGTYCLFSSGKLNGETCIYSNDCLAGYGCVGPQDGTHTCTKYCRSVSDCNGATCTLFSGEDYGYCN